MANGDMMNYQQRSNSQHQHWAGDPLYFQQYYNPPRCECHACTQARYKQTFQGQWEQQMQAQAAKQAMDLATMHWESVELGNTAHGDR